MAFRSWARNIHWIPGSWSFSTEFHLRQVSGAAVDHQVKDSLRLAQIDARLMGLKERCMKKLWSLGLLTMIGGATACAGSINIETPLVSGDVSSYESRHISSHAELSPEQLQALSSWLALRISGWEAMPTEASSEPVELQVNAKDRHGHVTHISVIAGARGHYLLLSGSPGTVAYRSLGGLLESWAASRKLSDQKVAALRALVGAT
jgi:hypothetical protein